MLYKTILIILVKGHYCLKQNSNVSYK